MTDLTLSLTIYDSCFALFTLKVLFSLGDVSKIEKSVRNSAEIILIEINAKTKNGPESEPQRVGVAI
jgi:hypothetical protein